jgi:hypothetical protein
MWNPRRLTTLWASTACYMDSITFLYLGNVCYYSVQNLLSSLLGKNVIICTTLILSVALYECKIWSLTLREQDRLRVFVRRMLRRIFRPKRDKVIGEWKCMRLEELHSLSFSLNIIRMTKSMMIIWAGHFVYMGRFASVRLSTRGMS